MKHLFFIHLFLICFSVYGQSRKCDGSVMGVYIGDEDAIPRQELFLKKKFKDLNISDENKCLTYNYQAFKELLDSVSVIKNGKYKNDGLRIYFAVRLSPIGNQHYNKMILIFTPTINEPGSDVHSDSLSSYWIIENKSLIAINRDTARNWVKQYEDTRLKKFELGGKIVSGNTFNETKSLWYKIENLDDSNKISGLRNFIQCLIESHKAKDITIHFAAFARKKEPYYQLTLVFDLNDEEYFTHKLTFTHRPFFVKLANKKKPAAFYTYADTGNPCPPGVCKGTSLSRN